MYAGTIQEEIMIYWIDVPVTMHLPDLADVRLRSSQSFVHAHAVPCYTCMQV